MEKHFIEITDTKSTIETMDFEGDYADAVEEAVWLSNCWESSQHPETFAYVDGKKVG